MAKRKILLQLDSDPQPSSFDSVVAVDAGVDQLLTYGGVTEDQVVGLVHGAIFTRGIDDLSQTAIFVGGSDVTRGEAMMKQVQKAFFGPMRVSVMMDANGANTTAAAAVLAAARHLQLDGSRVVVLAGTGPVGQRVTRLLVSRKAEVTLTTRNAERGERVCAAIRQAYPDARLDYQVAADSPTTAQALQGATGLIAAGPAGVEMLAQEDLAQATGLRVAIDLNAVPPLGLGGIQVQDKAVERQGIACYGAVGVGGTKMKIHKEALQRLFTSRDLELDAEQILAIGQALETP